MNISEHNAEIDCYHDPGDICCEREQLTGAGENAHSDKRAVTQGSSGRPLVMLSKLTSAISVKQKLVDELVEKQRYARRLTEQYDDQLNYLKQGIQSVQKRRDQELSKLDEQTKEVCSVYENKLTAMTGELKQLVSASKLHIVNVRSQQTGQKQLYSLQKQVVDMNKLRSQLMQSIQSNMRRCRQTELERNKLVDNCNNIVSAGDVGKHANDAQTSKQYNVKKPTDKASPVVLDKYLQDVLCEAQKDLARLRVDIGFSRSTPTPTSSSCFLGSKRREQKSTENVVDASVTNSATNSAVKQNECATDDAFELIKQTVGVYDQAVHAEGSNVFERDQTQQNARQRNNNTGQQRSADDDTTVTGQPQHQHGTLPTTHNTLEQQRYRTPTNNTPSRSGSKSTTNSDLLNRVRSVYESELRELHEQLAEVRYSRHQVDSAAAVDKTSSLTDKRLDALLRQLGSLRKENQQMRKQLQASSHSGRTSDF